MWASEKGHAEVVKALIDAGANFAMENVNMSPLIIAARRNYLPIAKLLVEAGVHRHRNRSGETALDWARSLGNVEVAENLSGL